MMVIFGITMLFFAAPEQAVAPARPAKSERQKMRCVTYNEIGSLAKIVKRCHTIEEWRKISEAAQGDLSELTKPSLASTNGN
jgi:hypothetical protein